MSDAVRFAVNPSFSHFKGVFFSLCFRRKRLVCFQVVDDDGSWLVDAKLRSEAVTAGPVVIRML